MSKLTSQANLKEGLRILDEELAPSSAGAVSNQGFHIPDVDLIDAQNALPTINGYTSFFGTGDTLEVTPLSSTIRIQEEIVYKTLHGNTIQIAFCEKGLYIRALAGDGVSVLTNVPVAGDDPEYDKIDLPAGKGAWIEVLSTVPLSTWKQWTFTLMSNTLYVYQKGMNFVGNITSYRSEQVIFEHLVPTYIIGTGQRHTFTYTSEDDSAGDDTYKRINITTDTGLDFGVQQIAVDSASDVARAMEAWEAIFSSTGFFSFEATETLRTEVDIDALIAIDLTLSELQAIIADTSHDGAASELTLTAIGE